MLSALNSPGSKLLHTISSLLPLPSLCSALVIEWILLLVGPGTSLTSSSDGFTYGWQAHCAVKTRRGADNVAAGHSHFPQHNAQYWDAIRSIHPSIEGSSCCKMENRKSGWANVYSQFIMAGNSSGCEAESPPPHTSQSHSSIVDAG